MLESSILFTNLNCPSTIQKVLYIYVAKNVHYTSPFYLQLMFESFPTKQMIFAKNHQVLKTGGPQPSHTGNGAPAQLTNKEGMKPQMQLKLQCNCAFISETSLSEDLLFPLQFL